METIIHLKASELNINFFKRLKTFLTKEVDMEIKIKAFSPAETQEECNKRIEKTIEDVECGRNLIRFTAKEFDSYMTNLLKQ